jgi:iron complex outermembrane receptor protein
MIHPEGGHRVEGRARFRFEAAARSGAWRRLACCAAAMAALAASAAPLRGENAADDASEAAADALPSDLTTISLEELLDIEITSVSKKPERMRDAAAAVFVITSEDLRRSGVRSVPDALRMVPGVHVAQIDANKWAISARGFNSRFANKLLVLIDGRSVYTPLFSGVYWEIQDTLLEDIDRIEVIRGPGGTLWGANAVNGIINIITKRARDTQGLYAAAGAGTETRAFGEARFGARVGESIHYRVWGKYHVNDGFVDDDGDHTNDDWESLRGGFRMEWEISAADLVTVQGDAYYTRAGGEYVLPTLSPPFALETEDNAGITGQDIVARWNRRLSDGSDFTLQAYYDGTTRDDRELDYRRDTFDLDFQHRFRASSRIDVLWGTNYRVTYDQADRDRFLSFDPSNEDHHLLSAFIQNDIEAIEGILRLTIGSKFDYNDYTKFEVQPSARLLWTPRQRHRFWAAVSRAVRTPSRADTAVRAPYTTLPTAPPTSVVFLGDDRFTSEDLLALEAGYRTQPADGISLDLAVFYNHYENLRSFETAASSVLPGPPVHVLQPAIFDNDLEADAYGVELAANWVVNAWWRMAASAGFFKEDLRLDRSSTDTLSENMENQQPRHQAALRSSMDLPGHVELDAAVYYVDSLRSFDVPGYVRVDVRLGWKPFGDDRLDVILGVQNALESHHEEFGRELHEAATEVERNIYAALQLRF